MTTAADLAEILHDARARKILRNMLKNHGKLKTLELLAMLKDPAWSGQAIGDWLGVSRERVRQWRDVFVVEVRAFRWAHGNPVEYLRALERAKGRE